MSAPEGHGGRGLATYDKGGEIKSGHASAHIGGAVRGGALAAGRTPRRERQSRRDGSPYAMAHIAAGMLNKAVGRIPESKSGYSAAAGLACAAEPAGGALAWPLKRRGRHRGILDQRYKALKGAGPR